MKIDKLRIELIEKITAFIIITNTIIIGVEASFHSKDKFLSIFYFIEQNSLLQELLNGITSEDEYLETYSKIEIPLTNYIKKMIK